MKFNPNSAWLLAVLASQVLARTTQLTRRRTTSILNNPDPQPDLPTAAQAATAAKEASLNLTNIQGDILVGMKKKKELFFFFSIVDAATFKTQLRRKIAPLITTTTQLLSISTQPTTAVNIAFSSRGLAALNITDDLNDSIFSAGQLADAPALGDASTDNWVAGFAGASIHGVLLLASDSVANVKNQLSSIQTTLGHSIKEVHRLQGAARPGSEEGHEHFGFMDGISQPAVVGFNDLIAKPGQIAVQPGIILLGEDGDSTRPTWAKDGSFLAFRQLKQLVPEFNKYLIDQAALNPGVTPDLLGARMVGRWKSGAPIDLAPTADDADLAADPSRNNNFTFAHDGEDLTSDQTRCPFSAHIRKARPRADFDPEDTVRHIMRASIPYGSEVTSAETTANATTNERGLAFVSYQSDISLGFRFIQQSWANNPNFIFGKNDSTPGVDPIIGSLAGASRVVSGLIPNDPSKDLTMGDFVVSRGGEYFFSPSISAISTTLSS